jgi:hypothetical protein
LISPFTSTPVVVTKNNRWSVRVISLLLVVQALSFVMISIAWLSEVDWTQEPIDLAQYGSILEKLAVAILLLPVVVILLLTAIGFLFQRRAAWLLAMLTQGFVLFTCLSSYFGEQLTVRSSNWFYGIMLYSIVLVLYLNTNDIRVAFTARPHTPDSPPLTAAEFERIETHSFTPIGGQGDERTN